MLLPACHPSSPLPHQEPCRLSGLLAAALARRFGSSAIDGVEQSRWVARGGYLPGLMVCAVNWEAVDGSALEKIQWASYEEPNPENMPCGVFVCGQPNPMEWVWGISRLFDRAPGLSIQCEHAWLNYMSANLASLSWAIRPWPGKSL